MYGNYFFMFRDCQHDFSSSLSKDGPHVSSSIVLKV